MTVLAFVLLTLFGVAAFIVRRLEPRILFPARRAGDATALLQSALGESVWLEAAGARTEAWFLPPLAQTGKPAPLVIFTHGNGELIDDWVREFDEVRHWGVAVLLVEYPGYGRSGGSPSESAIAATMRAAYDWVTKRPDVDPERVIGYGRSLGGGAMCVLVAERKLAALVLESTFTSVRTIAAGLYVPGFLVPDPFDSVSRVAGFRGPVLIVHGERDAVIPVAHAHELKTVLPQAELVILGDCGHNDCPRPWPKLREFLSTHHLL